MITALAILLACQLAGEITVRALGLPLPGPVLGMLLLTGLLLGFPRLVQAIRATAEGLLANLSLLFVPAGTGIVAHLDRLGPDGPALLAAIVGSTVIGLAVTVVTFTTVTRLTQRRG